MPFGRHGVSRSLAHHALEQDKDCAQVPHDVPARDRLRYWRPPPFGRVTLYRAAQLAARPSRLRSALASRPIRVTIVAAAPVGRIAHIDDRSVEQPAAPCVRDVIEIAPPCFRRTVRSFVPHPPLSVVSGYQPARAARPRPLVLGSAFPRQHAFVSAGPRCRPLPRDPVRHDLPVRRRARRHLRLLSCGRCGSRRLEATRLRRVLHCVPVPGATQASLGMPQASARHDFVHAGGG